MRALCRRNPAGPGAGPEDITTGPDGRLWFTEWNSDIGRFSPGGGFVTFRLGSVAFGLAWSITRGPDGNLWFIDGDGDYMGRITPDGKITEFSGPPLPGVDSGPPAATAGIKIITAGPDGNLWFTDAGNNKIGRITVSK